MQVEQIAATGKPETDANVGLGVTLLVKPYRRMVTVTLRVEPRVIDAAITKPIAATWTMATKPC